jgi:hypothetical protein
MIAIVKYRALGVVPYFTSPGIAQVPYFTSPEKRNLVLIKVATHKKRCLEVVIWCPILHHLLEML